MTVNGLINVGDFSSFVVKNLVSNVINNYKPVAPIYPKIFQELKTNRSFVQDTLTSNFMQIPRKDPGAPTPYFATSQGYSKRYNMQVNAGGFQITDEAARFVDIGAASIIETLVPQLMSAAMRTLDQQGADVFDKGWTDAGADGSPLFSPSHSSAAGFQSNILTSPAPLTTLSLEQVLINIASAKDYNGNVINLRPRYLVVPPKQQFTAERILNSVAVAGSANNDINAIRTVGGLEGIIVNPYLDSDTKWYVTTDAPQGLKHYTETAPMITQDKAFDNFVSKYIVYFCGAFGYSDFRGVYGSGNY